MKDCVETIPALNDNWVYLIRSQNTDEYMLIDAGEAAPVIDNLQGKALKHLLFTHHHGDHIAGASDIQKHTGCQMHGIKADLEQLPNGTEALPESWKWQEYAFDIILAPGHTLNHVMFYEKNNHWLFSGDTLFIAGCGRLFEGSHEQMYDTLQKIKSLPDDTKLFCGHDYTLSNLTFAKHLFPGDVDINKGYELAKLNNFPHSTTLATEKKINPFLKASTLEEFKKFRIMKDNF
ncbi:MAG: hydroxyacylglutathione hydrolase [Alphaproteobacteria bacterium]|nr:hydroxyacylglutathione hydrolase [Alphaproteobacteria bacterium]